MAGNAQVSLSWSASAGAAGYDVKRATAAGGAFAVVQSNVAAVTFTNTGLTDGSTYYYEVSAVNAAGESPDSSPVSATPTGGTAPPPPPPPPPPSGFPDATNTGYKNAPGYPGSLTTYSATANGTECSGPITSGKTYHFCYFPNGLDIGPAGSGQAPFNVTFFGSLFEAGFSGTNGNQSIVHYSNGNNITFSYDTFKPTGLTAPPVTHFKGPEYGINQAENPGSGYSAGGFTVDHCDFWGFAGAIQLGASSQTQPITISNSYFHDARADGGSEGVSIADQDHTDGIYSGDGEGVTYLTINHNTISSVGACNALALQVNSNVNFYEHVVVSNNYFSGFHLTIQFGDNGSNAAAGTSNKNDQFTGNVFGTDLAPTGGPLYINYGTNDSWYSSLGNIWRNNTLHYVPGGYVNDPSINGKYWWPEWTGQDYPIPENSDWNQ